MQLIFLRVIVALGTRLLCARRDTELCHPTTSNIGVSIISLYDTPRLHTLKRVIRILMRLAHI